MPCIEDKPLLSFLSRLVRRTSTAFHEVAAKKAIATPSLDDLQSDWKIFMSMAQKINVASSSTCKVFHLILCRVLVEFDHCIKFINDAGRRGICQIGIAGILHIPQTDCWKLKLWRWRELYMHMCQPEWQCYTCQILIVAANELPVVHVVLHQRLGSYNNWRQLHEQQLSASDTRRWSVLFSFQALFKLLTV
jgi:hypothetical protein